MKRIIINLIIIFVLFVPLITLAEVRIDYQYSTSSGSGSTGASSKYCASTGCRCNGGKGVRITVKNQYKSVSKDYMKDTNGNIELPISDKANEKYSLSSGFESIADEKNSSSYIIKLKNQLDLLKQDSDNGLIPNKNSFVDKFSKSGFYQLLLKVWSNQDVGTKKLTYKLKGSIAEKNEKGNETEVGASTNGYSLTFKEYADLLEGTYIIFEPIVCYSYGSSTGAYTFDWNHPLSSTDLDNIKNTGVSDPFASGISNDKKTKIWDMLGVTQYMDGIFRANDTGSINEIKRVWQAAYNFATGNRTKTYTGTVKEMANFIMSDSTNQKLAGTNSNGTRASYTTSDSPDGSISFHIGAISYYMHITSNIGGYTGVSSQASSWKQIGESTSGYGVAVISASAIAGSAPGIDPCVLKNGLPAVPEGIENYISSTDEVLDLKEKLGNQWENWMYCCNDAKLNNGDYKWKSIDEYDEFKKSENYAKCASTEKHDKCTKIDYDAILELDDWGVDPTTPANKINEKFSSVITGIDGDNITYAPLDYCCNENNYDEEEVRRINGNDETTKIGTLRNKMRDKMAKKCGGKEVCGNDAYSKMQLVEAGGLTMSDAKTTIGAYEYPLKMCCEIDKWEFEKDEDSDSSNDKILPFKSATRSDLENLIFKVCDNTTGDKCTWDYLTTKRERYYYKDGNSNNKSSDNMSDCCDYTVIYDTIPSSEKITNVKTFLNNSKVKEVCPVDKMCQYTKVSGQYKIIPPEGKDEKYCCDNKENQWVSDNNPQYLNFLDNKAYQTQLGCPKVNVCTWDNNRNQLTRYVTGENNQTIDCCLIDSYEKKDLIAGLQKNGDLSSNIKNPTNEMIDSAFKKTNAYLNMKCTDSKKYCDPTDESSFTKECCDNPEKYDDEYRTIFRRYNNFDEAAGLNSYLRENYLSLYKKVCPIVDCLVDTVIHCPNCDNDANENGFVSGVSYDTVDSGSGTVDSTLISKDSISDEDKKCIVKESKFKNNQIGNKYCEVYCTEKIVYDYPQTIKSVEAGRIYPLGVASITTVKTCRIDGVKEKKFLQDLNSKAIEVQNAYDDYLKYKEAQSKAQDKIKDVTYGSTGYDNNVCSCKNQASISGYTTKIDCCTSSATIQSYDYEYGGPFENQISDGTAGAGNLIQNIANDLSNMVNDTPSVSDTVQNAVSNGTSGITNIFGNIVSDKGNEFLENATNILGNLFNFTSYNYQDTVTTTKYNDKIKTEIKSIKSNYGISSGTPPSGYNCNGYEGYDTTSRQCYRKKTTCKTPDSTTYPKAVLVNQSTCTYGYCTNVDETRWDYQYVEEYTYGTSSSGGAGAIGNVISKIFNNTKKNSEANMCKTDENANKIYSVTYPKLEEYYWNIVVQKQGEYDAIIKMYESCFDIPDEILNIPDYDFQITANYVQGRYSHSDKMDKTSLPTPESFMDDEIKSANRITRAFSVLEHPGRIKTTREAFDRSEPLKINNVYQGVLDKTIYSVSVQRQYEYRLKSGYEYINKGKPESVKEKEQELQQIAVGSHLPVDYDITEDGLLELSLSLDNSDSVHVRDDLVLCTEEQNSDNVYSCPFNVYDRLLLQPGGVLPVYRPIKLSNPFPDQNGLGRNTGVNWCSEDDCSNTNETVRKYITYNRGQYQEDVYNLKPLYTITLTPMDIRNIRNYNSTTNYNDFKLTCDSNGNYCESSFVRGSYAAGFDLNAPSYNLYDYGLINLNRSCAIQESAGCVSGDLFNKSVGGAN